jgi:hypothetical protein
MSASGPSTLVRLGRRSEGDALVVQQRLVGWVGFFLGLGSPYERVFAEGSTSAVPTVIIRRSTKEMIHMLIVAAVILFVLWLLFHATGALINLLWIGIVVLAVIWLVGLLRGRRTTT